jgi:hypothetical protein
LMTSGSSAYALFPAQLNGSWSYGDNQNSALQRM